MTFPSRGTTVESEQMIGIPVERYLLTHLHSNPFRIVSRQHDVRAWIAVESEDAGKEFVMEVINNPIELLPSESQAAPMEVRPPRVSTEVLLVDDIPELDEIEARRDVVGIARCDEERIEVRLDPAALNARELSANEVMARLESSMTSVPMGKTSTGLSTVQKGGSVELIAGIALDDAGTTVRDVGRVARVPDPTSCRCASGDGSRGCALVQVTRAGVKSVQNALDSKGIWGEELAVIGLRTTPRGETDPAIRARALASNVDSRVTVIAPGIDGDTLPIGSEVGVSSVVIVPKEVTSQLDLDQPGLETFQLDPPHDLQLVVEITGPDREQLITAQRRMESALKEDGRWRAVPSFRAMPQLQVSIDKESAAELGVTTQDITSTLRLRQSGRWVASIREDGDAMEVYVLLGEPSQPSAHNLDHLLNTPVWSVEGQRVPLSSLVNVQMTTEAAQLWRLNGHSGALVRVLRRPGGPVVDQSEVSGLVDQVELPDGVTATIEWW